MQGALSDRQVRDSGPKLVWPEFDSFAPIEDAGCLRNRRGDNRSPDRRAAFPGAGGETGPGRGQV